MYSLHVQNPKTLGRHAVDAPFGVAVVVADCDREAAVIGPDKLDQLPFTAFYFQYLALACVCRVVSGWICKNRRNELAEAETADLI